MLKKTIKNTQKLTYNQPKVYVLGSLEQVQSSSQGDKCDGAADGWYYYQSNG